MSSGKNGHMDSMVATEGSPGFGADWGGTPNFYACSNKATGTVPVYRGALASGTGGKLTNLHMSALDSSELTNNQFALDYGGAPMYYVYNSAAPGTTPVYRRWNAVNFDRILTKTSTEGDPDYATEKGGPFFYAFSSPS